MYRDILQGLTGFYWGLRLLFSPPIIGYEVQRLRVQSLGFEGVILGFRLLYYPPGLENQTEKNMEHEMDAGGI